MDLVLIAVVSLGASFLSLFSGFGLGTILLPVFAIFLPTDMAVAATAIVHGANNVLKVLVAGRLADFKIVWRFGLAAIATAYVGAVLLVRLAHLPPWFSYQCFGARDVSPLSFVLGVLILGFAVLELHPGFKHLSFNRKYLPLGGMLSGFFGGLSGHQGALRSAFLTKVDLTPQAFIGTNAVIGLAVDAIRLLTYGTMLSTFHWRTLPVTAEGRMILTGSIAAVCGVLLGMQFLHKITMTTIQRLTGLLLVVIGLLMAAGLL
ncbi:MAG: sulfite exporter TauE/SafE family protein [Deltaproteobacteria bacterium]|nr:sulfite exporter TauE/SafE family protein [Deltaproteobacteria bacterium]